MVIRHAEMEEHLLRATVGERVGIKAGPPFGGVHDACCIGVVRHVRYAAKVESVLHGRSARVVFEDDAALVAGHGLGSAVTEPEKIPVVAVGGVWDGICGGAEEPLGAEGVVEELGAEGGIPVGVVFEGESGREAVINDARDRGKRRVGEGREGGGSLLVRKLHVRPPAADNGVSARAVFEWLPSGQLAV